MKEVLDKVGFNFYLMIQFVGYYILDVGRVGFVSLFEIFFGVNLFYCVLFVCIIIEWVF